jgi:hypothetical protein
MMIITGVDLNVTRALRDVLEPWTPSQDRAWPIFRKKMRTCIQ